MASLLSYALTNLSDVKESLGLSSSDASKDNLIVRSINKATLAIENYCGRRFLETNYVQEYAATQIDQIILRQRPITSTVPLTLEYRNSSLNYSNFEFVDSKLYFCDVNSTEGNAGVIDLMFVATGRWNRYRITYSAGYATIPADLAEACASLATFYVNTASGVHVALAGIKEGQRELSYSRQLNTLTFRQIISQLGIDSIIDSYANNPVLADK